MLQPPPLLSSVSHNSNFSRTLMIRTASLCRLGMTSTPGRLLLRLAKQMKFLLRWQLIIKRQALPLRQRQRLIWSISNYSAHTVSSLWGCLQANSSWCHSYTIQHLFPWVLNQALFSAIGSRKATMPRLVCSRTTWSRRLDQGKEFSTWAHKRRSRSISSLLIVFDHLARSNSSRIANTLIGQRFKGNLELEMPKRPTESMS